MSRCLAILLLLAAGGCSFDGGVSSGVQDSSSDAGEADAEAEADAEPPVPAYALQVNLGGGAYQGTEYLGLWLEDDGSYCTGGFVNTNFNDFHNTEDDPLFQAYRRDYFACAFGERLLDDGQYRVTLLMAEAYRGDGCVGASTTRIFDVSIEGNIVLENFDLMEATGGCVASLTIATAMPVARSFVVDVADGTVDLFTSGQTSAVISAIQIESLALAN